MSRDASRSPAERLIELLENYDPDNFDHGWEMAELEEKVFPRKRKS